MNFTKNNGSLTDRAALIMPQCNAENVRMILIWPLCMPHKMKKHLTDLP
jgi:hypothetical protein